MKYVILIFFYIVFTLCLISNSLYINLEISQPKCLYDEYFGDAVVTIKYSILNNYSFLPDNNQQEKNKLKKKNKGYINFVIVNETTKDEIIRFSEFDLNGKFSFHLENSVKIMICVESDYKNWFSSEYNNNANNLLEVEFKVFSSDDEIEKDIATASDISSLDLGIKTAHSMSLLLEKMQNSTIQVEEEFANSQEKNSSSIVFFCILQIFIIVIAGVFQFYNLKNIYNRLSY